MNKDIQMSVGRRVSAASILSVIFGGLLLLTYSPDGQIVLGVALGLLFAGAGVGAVATYAYVEMVASRTTAKEVLNS